MILLLTRVITMLLALGCVLSSLAQPTPDRKHLADVKARAEKGDPEAQLQLGDLYYAGIGVSRDPKAGAKWHKKAAEQGLAKAQLELAEDYARGDGVKPDAFEAFRWSSLAADQGLPEAQVRCGVCFMKGDGVPRNVVEAMNQFRKAADQGFPPAEYEVGKGYLEGNGVAKDIEEGVKWIRKSAAQGFSSGQYRLGLCYFKGEGVAKDHTEAHKWLNLAAGQGGPDVYDAKITLSKVETLMNAEEIAQAQRLAREFRPSRGEVPPAADASAATVGGSLAQSGGAVSGDRFGWVMVTSPDDGCEVLVNREFVGNTPAKVKLPEGVHLVEVKKSGFRQFSREIKVSDGAELTLRAVLEKQ